MNNEWAQLLRQRNTNPDQDFQNAVGKAEHAAYAKMRVKDRPLWGPIEQAVSIPAYTAAKALGLRRGRSEPSLDEVGAGYAGMLSGLKENVGDAMNYVTDSPSPIAEPPRSPTMSEGLTEGEIRAMVLRSYGKK